MQVALGTVGIVIFIAILFFLPETSHPGARGIDKLRMDSMKTEASSSRMFVFVNPIRPLALMRSPNVLAVVRTLEPLNRLRYLIFHSLLQDFLYF